MKFQRRNFRKHSVSAECMAPVFGSRALAPVLLVLAAFAAGGSAAAAPCQGPGAPANTQTKCLTAILLPGGAQRGRRRI